MKPLVSVIILSYNSRRYIEKCLDTVLAQDYPRLEILIINNGSDDGSAELVNSEYGRHKQIRILEPGRNLWYSRGNNLGIREAKGDYILALNQDTVLENDFISLLVDVLDHDPDLGSASGKLRHFNFAINSKTKILDSTGIEIFKTRRVIDRGQWEQDFGQYDEDTEIFGASGAAAMYRRSALEAVKILKKDRTFEYFDEDFVAYKEDIDLSWRLQLAGFRCRYVPQAVLYHGRTVGRSWPTQFIRFILNRRRQSRLVRKLSFKNHYLMMIKNEVRVLFWRHFVYIFIREILLLVYTLIFEFFQFMAIGQLFKDIPGAWSKRQQIMAKVKVRHEDLRKLFH